MREAACLVEQHQHAINLVKLLLQRLHIGRRRRREFVLERLPGRLERLLLLAVLLLEHRPQRNLMRRRRLLQAG